MFNCNYTLGSLACQDENQKQAVKQAINLMLYNSIIEDNCENGNKFDEKICLSYMDGRKWHNEFYRPDEFEKLINYGLDYYHSYYITNHSLKEKAISRRAENLFSLRNIVIDIDAHKYWDEEKPTPAGFQKLVDELIYRVTRDTKEIGFNFAVETGRGVQFWLCMEETSKALQFAHRRAVNTLCRVMSDILADYGLDEVFEVDESSSKKEIGLFRLPGSYNPKVQQFTVVHFFSDVLHDYNELNETITNTWDLVWNDQAQKNKPQKKKKARITPISIAEKDYLALMYKRVSLIETLVDKGFIDVGNREIAMFLYFNAARQLAWTGETADDKTVELNRKLKSPLKPSELRAIFRNRKVYKISNKTWYDYLGIDPKDTMDLVQSQNNITRDFKRKQKKSDRDEAIIALYKKGVPILEISKTLEISRNTVRKVLDTKNLKTTRQTEGGIDMTYKNMARDKRRAEAKASRNQQIEDLYKQQVPIHEIARNMGIGLNTIRRYLDSKGLRTTKQV